MKIPSSDELTVDVSDWHDIHLGTVGFETVTFSVVIREWLDDNLPEGGYMYWYSDVGSFYYRQYAYHLSIKEEEYMMAYKLRWK